jgi:integrase
MPRQTKLTALQIKELVRSRKQGRHLASENLYLSVKPSGTASWLYRYMFASRVVERDDGTLTRVGAHWAGLGKYPRVDLAEARARARHFADQLDQGIDPLAYKRKKVSEQRIADAKTITFGECATKFLTDREGGWKNAKHAAQWRASFEGSTRLPAATAVINDVLIGDVDTELAKRVLKPIWEKKPETASRVRQRCEAVVAWAMAHGYRDGKNPFTWRGHLDAVLPKTSALKKLRGTRHHPALPYTDLPAFMAQLRRNDSLSARALEFAILTAARTAEIIGARWREFDLQAGVWTIPAVRMKAGKEHRVPLSDRALAILRALPVDDDDRASVFPLSQMAMLELLRGMRPGFTVHGCRSTFRDWAAETTAYPRDACERALAHGIKNKTEAAYERTDLFDKRRSLMRDWANFCAMPSERTGKNVTSLRRGRVL